ncbi:type IV pilin protein [Teredinibacter franksiae]|uniref:type IV pilin protein n=1 Tax=Teredinibacter franksiae TaxID=2761453 RepID=UPI0016241D6A|nr:type IV pilin protein [Teredinibacter franksiae]
MTINQKGFNLIELMIVVAVVGILSAIAIPAYRDSALKSHRAEGLELLLQVAQNQEVLYSQTNAYSTNAVPFAPVAATTTSEHGYYVVSVAQGACGNASCFIATATAQGSQTDDDECLTITIDSLGGRGSTPLGGECWQ